MRQLVQRRFVVALSVLEGLERRHADMIGVQRVVGAIAAVLNVRAAIGEELLGNFDALQRRGATWVAPKLVAQIEYRAWSSDNILRHSAFKALREDKPAKNVSRPKLIAG